MAQNDPVLGVPPASQVDLERRRAADHNPKKIAEAIMAEDTNGGATSYAVEDNDTSGYIGVDREYATYANETEKPLQAEEGVEAELEEALTQPTVVSKVEVPAESRQITGTGSADPLIYSETSGAVFETQRYEADKVPTTVAELTGEGTDENDEPVEKVGSTTPSPTEGAVEQPTAPKPVSAPPTQTAPQAPGTTSNPS